MIKKTNNLKTHQRSKQRTVKILLLAFLVMLAYVAWYAYCHYYPEFGNRHSTSALADYVNSEYRFGDVNSTHLAAAKNNGIQPAANKNELQTNNMTKIGSCDNYKVASLKYSHAYLTPKAADLLNEIGSRFQAVLREKGIEKHRIIVTSLLRTKDDVECLQKVNRNAVANSAHQYATTFDISYVRFDRQSVMGKGVSNKQLANILGGVLKQLRNEGRCYVKYEQKQHCFHITSRK